MLTAFWFLFAGKYFNILFPSVWYNYFWYVLPNSNGKNVCNPSLCSKSHLQVANSFLLQLSGLISPSAIYPIDLANTLEALYFLQVNYK